MRLIDVVLENVTPSKSLYSSWVEILNHQYEQPIIDNKYNEQDFLKLYHEINSSSVNAQVDFVIGPHVNKIFSSADDKNTAERSKRYQKVRLIWIFNRSPQFYQSLFTAKGVNPELVMHSLVDHRLNGKYRVDDPYGEHEIVPLSEYSKPKKSDWPATVIIDAVKLAPDSIGTIIHNFDNMPPPLKALEIAAKHNQNIYKEYKDFFDYYKKLNTNGQIAMVKKDGMAIKDLYELGMEPKEEVKKAAVLQNCRAIQFIPKPSYNLQVLALEQAHKTGIHHEIYDLIQGPKSENIEHFMMLLDH